MYFMLAQVNQYLTSILHQMLCKTAHFGFIPIASSYFFRFSIGCREKVYVDMQQPFLNLHEVCNAHAHNQYTAKLLNIGRFLIADPIIGATLEITVCVRWM